MRVICLNTWGGRMFASLMKFVEEEKGKTDVFMFQEIYDTPAPSDVKELSDRRLNMLAELKIALPEFQPFFSPTQEDSIGHDWVRDPHLEYGNAMFIRKEIKVFAHGEYFVFRHKNARVSDAFTDGRNIEFAEIENNGKRYTLVNFHGTWNGQGKGDSPDRLEQSRKIRTFLSNVEGPKILAGDFNLEPETESLKIAEEGMVNLIKQYGITSTRSDLYEKPIKFADYVFVSPDITVKSFTVPNIPISDHLPMIVEFE